MSGLILYTREDGKSRIQLRADGQTVWLTQLEMAELFYEDKNYVQARAYYDRYVAVAQENARSLLLGSRLATIYEDRDKAASIGLQLKRLYPGTPEYQQYVLEHR